MKTLSKLLATFAILTLILFSGCTKEVVVEVPKPYAVPVKCATPDVNCSVEGNDVAIITGLLKCIVDLKRANKVCK